MPRTAKKTSRTSSKSGMKKSGTKAGTSRKRKPASSTAGRTKSATSARAKSKRNASTRSRGVRAARGSRAREGAAPKALKYSKWIEATDDHEDRKGQSLATRNHDVIRQWAEQREAVPSTVESTQGESSAGVLRLNFPGYGGQRLEEVSWDDWFRTFDERNLVFLFQEHKTDGSVSNFFKLNNPDE
jgi:hypothetical protein